MKHFVILACGASSLIGSNFLGKSMVLTNICKCEQNVAGDIEITCEAPSTVLNGKFVPGMTFSAQVFPERVLQ